MYFSHFHMTEIYKHSDMSFAWYNPLCLMGIWSAASAGSKLWVHFVSIWGLAATETWANIWTISMIFITFPEGYCAFFHCWPLRCTFLFFCNTTRQSQTPSVRRSFQNKAMEIWREGFINVNDRVMILVSLKQRTKLSFRFCSGCVRTDGG